MIDLLDLHTHTTASGHAYNSLYEMAASASGRGIRIFGSSDHAPAMPGSSHYYHFINFKVLPRTLYGMKLLMGVELNIMDFEGNVDLDQDFLEKLDYSIASLHQPCIKSGTASQNTDAYLGAMKNPAIHIIGHPDDCRFPIDYDTLTAAAREHHKLLEVNNSSLTPLSYRQGVRENYARRAGSQGDAEKNAFQRIHTGGFPFSDAADQGGRFSATTGISTQTSASPSLTIRPMSLKRTPAEPTAPPLR